METINDPPVGIENADASESSLNKTALIWLVAILILMAGYFGGRKLAGYPFIGAPALHGFEIDSPLSMGDWELTAHTGERVALHDYRDKIVLIYFGYAYCPDICPATMSELAGAYHQLSPKQKEKVQVLMITIDPERDTPEFLEEYLAYFDPSFIGLTGTKEEIDAAGAPLGIFYQRVEVEGSAGYLYDHSATVAILDKQGHLRGLYPFDTPADDIYTDLRFLVRE